MVGGGILQPPAECVRALQKFDYTFRGICLTGRDRIECWLCCMRAWVRAWIGSCFCGGGWPRLLVPGLRRLCAHACVLAWLRRPPHDVLIIICYSRGLPLTIQTKSLPHQGDGPEGHGVPACRIFACFFAGAGGRRLLALLAFHLCACARARALCSRSLRSVPRRSSAPHHLHKLTMQVDSTGRRHASTLLVLAHPRRPTVSLSSYKITSLRVSGFPVPVCARKLPWLCVREM